MKDEEIFEKDTKLLIINPTIETIEKLKVQFKEIFTNIKYLAQIRELSDDNSFNTLIFFENNDKTYIFKEYENPQHATYHSETKEELIEKFWESLEEIDNITNNNFFKKTKTHYDYVILNDLINKNNKINNKKIKM